MLGFLPMRQSIPIVAAIAAFIAAPIHADEALEHAKQVLERSILFDGHNDLPWAIREYKAAPGDVNAYDIRGQRAGAGETDIPRLREGKVGAVFWSVYTPPEAAGGFAKTQLEQIDIARRLIARYPDTFTLASTAADIRAAKKAGRIGSMLGLEGGHAIEDSLGALRAYYDLGVRYMTLTHNAHTSWADSAMQDPPQHNGLNAFGEQVVHEMNRLGMLIDLSHTSPDTMRDAIRVSEAPVIFSHSASRAVCEIPRNVPDDVLAMLPKNGGVIMVTFVSGFVSQAAADVTLPMMREYLARAKGKTPEERTAIYEELKAKVKMPNVTRRGGRRPHRPHPESGRRGLHRYRQRFRRQHELARGPVGRIDVPEPVRGTGASRMEGRGPREDRRRQRAARAGAGRSRCGPAKAGGGRA